MYQLAESLFMLKSQYHQRDTVLPELLIVFGLLEVATHVQMRNAPNLLVVVKTMKNALVCQSVKVAKVLAKTGANLNVKLVNMVAKINNF